MPTTLNFPSNPTLNQTYSFGGKTWIWTGQAWRLSPQGAINGIVIGNASPSTGAFTILTASLLAAGPATFSGNIVGPNISVAHSVSAETVSVSGNVTANYFIGNGSQLTGVISTGVAGNLVGNLNTGTYNLFSSSGAVKVNDTLSVTGNIITSGELLTGGPIATTANITGNYFIGDGSQLTNLPAGNYSNANVAAYLPTYSGNIAAGNITTTGNISSAYVLGNGSQLTGVLTSLVGPLTGNIDTLEYSINSSNGEVRFGNSISVIGNAIITDNLLVGDQIATTANVTANYFIGDGSQLTNLPAGNYSNANVAAYLPTYLGNITAGNVSTTGNVTGLYVLGNGSQLTGISTSLSGNLAGNINTGPYNLFSANGAVQVNDGLSVTGTVTTTGGLVSGGPVATTANITGNYFIGDGSQLTNLPAGNYSNANVAAYLPTYTGNVAANNFIGNGATLTNITGANVVGVVANATNAVNSAQANYANIANSVTGSNVVGIVANAAYAVTASSANTANTAGLAQYVTANVQANITGLGVLTSLSSTGNITAPYFVGNGSQLSGVVKSLAGNLAGNIDTLEYSINSSNGEVRFGNSISVIGNAIITDNLLVGDQIATTGNITTTANVSAQYFVGNFTGNISGNLVVPGSNTQVVFNTNGSADASSGLTFNKTSNVLAVGGNVSAVGNITANYFIGNGSQLTGIDATSIQNGSSNVKVYANANVATTVAGTANVVVVANTGAYVSGVVSATGNVIGNYILGNISQATGYNSNKIFNGTSNVEIATSNGNIGLNVANAVVGTVSSTGVEIVGVANVSGNVTGGNIITPGLFTAVGNVISGNVTTSGQVSSAGNITGGNIITPGQLTVTGNATILGNLLVDGNVTYINIENLNVEDPIIGLGRGPNNTPLTTNDAKDRGEQLWYYSTAENSAFIGWQNSTGKLLGATNVTITNEVVTVNNYGNITLGNIEGISASLTGNITANVISGNTAAFVGNITTSANISAQYFVGNFAGNISGNLTVPGSNTQVIFNTQGAADATSGFTFDKVSNLVAVGGNISSVGNVTASYFIGNGSQLTGIDATSIQAGSSNVKVYANANVTTTVAGVANVLVVANTGTYVSGLVSVTGNVIGANVNTSGVVSSTGNVIAGNITTPGDVSATGNITGNYFVGNGSQLTGIDATSIQNGNSNVKVYANGNVTTTVAGVANVLVITDTGAYVTGLASVTGNVTATVFNSTSDLTIASGSNGNLLISADGTGIAKITGPTGFVVPVGNTAQRPVTVDAGTLRLNSTLNELEVYAAGSWQIVGSGSAGNTTVTDQQITPDGSSTVYTLDQVATTPSIMVAINGVTQTPTAGYTVTGNSITFSEAPLVTDDVDIRFLTAAAATPGVIFNSSANSSVQVNDVPEIAFTVNSTVRTTITANGIVDISTGRSIKMPLYTVAQADALTGRTEGEIIYVQNGDSGAACLAVFTGGVWKRVVLGAAISG